MLPILGLAAAGLAQGARTLAFGVIPNLIAKGIHRVQVIRRARRIKKIREADSIRKKNIKDKIRDVVGGGVVGGALSEIASKFFGGEGESTQDFADRMSDIADNAMQRDDQGEETNIIGLPQILEPINIDTNEIVPQLGPEDQSFQFTADEDIPGKIISREGVVSGQVVIERGTSFRGTTDRDLYAIHLNNIIRRVASLESAVLGQSRLYASLQDAINALRENLRQQDLEDDRQQDENDLENNKIMTRLDKIKNGIKDTIKGGLLFAVAKYGTAVTALASSGILNAIADSIETPIPDDDIDEEEIRKAATPEKTEVEEPGFFEKFFSDSEEEKEEKPLPQVSEATKNISKTNWFAELDKIEKEEKIKETADFSERAPTDALGTTERTVMIMTKDGPKYLTEKEIIIGEKDGTVKKDQADAALKKLKDVRRSKDRLASDEKRKQAQEDLSKLSEKDERYKEITVTNEQQVTNQDLVTNEQQVTNQNLVTNEQQVTNQDLVNDQNSKKAQRKAKREAKRKERILNNAFKPQLSSASEMKLAEANKEIYQQYLNFKKEKVKELIENGDKRHEADFYANIIAKNYFAKHFIEYSAGSPSEHYDESLHKTVVKEESTINSNKIVEKNLVNNEQNTNKFNLKNIFGGNENVESPESSTNILDVGENKFDTSNNEEQITNVDPVTDNSKNVSSNKRGREIDSPKPTKDVRAIDGQKSGRQINETDYQLKQLQILAQEAEVAYEKFITNEDRGTFKMVMDDMGFDEEKVYDDPEEQAKHKQLLVEKAGAINNFTRLIPQDTLSKIEFLQDRGLMPKNFSGNVSGYELTEKIKEYISGLEARAKGGPVEAGQEYLVGEEGLEAYISDSDDIEYDDFEAMPFEDFITGYKSGKLQEELKRVSANDMSILETIIKKQKAGEDLSLEEKKEMMIIGARGAIRTTFGLDAAVQGLVDGLIEARDLIPKMMEDEARKKAGDNEELYLKLMTDPGVLSYAEEAKKIINDQISQFDEVNEQYSDDAVYDIMTENMKMIQYVESGAWEKTIRANKGMSITMGLEPRAKGGPVEDGSDYLVGEEGPELMIPKEDGIIIPAEPTAKILDGTRRFGGPVKDNSNYLVGEEGPELMVPNIIKNIAVNPSKAQSTVVIPTIIPMRPAMQKNSKPKDMDLSIPVATNSGYSTRDSFIQTETMT